MLLAIDTSTHISSIALYDERGVIGETTWRSHENHTRSLMPAIVRQMELVQASTSDLRAIAVATGPGSFTGLRIGLAAAKGLAFSLSAALVGIPTLDVTAAAFADQPLPVYAVMQAGRNRFGAALFDTDNGLVSRRGDYFFGSTEALVAHLQAAGLQGTKTCVTGELNDELREALQREFDSSIILAHDGVNVRRAGVLAALALQKWRAGATDDIPTLAPFYIPTASLA